MEETQKELTEPRGYKDEKPSIIQFSSIKRTKKGFAIFIGKNVIFVNDGLLNHIKQAAENKIDKVIEDIPF